MRSYDLATGELVWECGGQTANAIPSPVVLGDTVICMSGYRGAAAKAIPLGARGDMTGSDKVIWSLGKGTPYVPSPLLYEARLYFTQRNSGILTVVDARTGKVEIDSQRIPGVEELYGSPVGAAGRVYFIARDGTAVVIRHGGPIEVLATNRLEEPVDASPALVGKKNARPGPEAPLLLRAGAEAGGRSDRRLLASGEARARHEITSTFGRLHGRDAALLGLVVFSAYVFVLAPCLTSVRSASV